MKNTFEYSFQSQTVVFDAHRHGVVRWALLALGKGRCYEVFR